MSSASRTVCVPNRLVTRSKRISSVGSAEGAAASPAAGGASGTSEESGESGEFGVLRSADKAALQGSQEKRGGVGDGEEGDPDDRVRLDRLEGLGRELPGL